MNRLRLPRSMTTPLQNKTLRPRVADPTLLDRSVLCSRPARSRYGLLGLLSALLLGSLAPAAGAQLTAGTAVVIDRDAGTGGDGALFRVGPVSGERTLLSDFGDATQGPLGVSPFDVALAADGSILVIDANAGTGGDGALFRVDPGSGDRTLLSDFGDAAQGPPGIGPAGITLAAGGDILVVDGDAGTGGDGALFSVDPASGNRTLLSDFGDAAQGPTGEFPRGLVVSTDGAILVSDIAAGTGGLGALFRVDPASGNRSLLSDFGDAMQGPLGADPFGVAVAAGGDLFVIDGEAGILGLGALFRVDLASGERSLLSDFGEPAQGSLGVDPRGVALSMDGNLLVIDADAGIGLDGALFSVDPASGNRILLSDFGDAAQGSLGREPVGVTVVPEGAGDPGDPGDPSPCVTAIPSPTGCVVNSFPGDCAGTPGDDVIFGTAADDVIVGMGGNDLIQAGAGDDLVCTGDGDDQIQGGPGSDTLDGGGGNDFLFGGARGGTDTCLNGEQIAGCEAP